MIYYIPIIQEVTMGSKLVWKFISRITFGIAIAVFIGNRIDKALSTTPWIMIALLVYVVFGSLFLLVKESSKGDK